MAVVRESQAQSRTSATSERRVVYDAEVAFDVDAGSLDAVVILWVPSTAAAGDTVRLLLNRGLAIREVTGDGVGAHQRTPFAMVPSWDVVSIPVAAGKPADAARTIRIVYGGRLELPANASNGILPTRVELGLDSQWFPVPARLDHELVGKLRFRFPADWQVISSGGPTSREGNRTVVHATVPQVDVALYAAPALRASPGKWFTAYFGQAGPRTVSAILQTADACADYMNGRFGRRYPFPRGRVVVADRSGTGYARNSYVVMSSVDPDSTESLSNFACHEISHYWTRLTAAMTADYWLSETFAEYAAAMYLRDSLSQAAFDRRRALWEQAGRKAGPVWTPSMTARQPQAVAYRRGPFLLWRLEERIGRERFARFFDGYMAEGIRETAPLLDHLARVADPDDAAWFRAELAAAPETSPNDGGLER